MRLFVVVVALLAAGCSYKSDLTAMCHAHEHADGAYALAEKTRLEAKYIDEHVHSSQGKALFEKMASELHGAARGEALQAEAAKEGVQPCPYADEIIARAKRSPSP